MPRSKTLLSAADQWAQTVHYVDYLHRNKWMEWNWWLKLYGFKVRWQQAPGLGEDQLREQWRQERDAGPRAGQSSRLSIAKQPHRVLNAGDVFVASINNGMGLRFPVFGISSKGTRLSHHYLPFAGTDPHRGIMQSVELPGDLINLRWDDPAIGRFVVDLRRKLP